MFRHRHQLRRWAARVLVLWLFGLGSGIASACLAGGLSDAAPVAAEHATDAHALHHDAAAHGSSHHGDEADPHVITGKTNCQDFCDKATVSIPLLKSALDAAQAHALMTTVVTTTALPVPALPPAKLQGPRRDGVRPLPIPIAFLRLTL
jgi:hypothetical protein